MAQLKSTSVTGNLSVTGNVVASQIVKNGGSEDELLLANGGTTSLSTIETNISSAQITANNANDNANSRVPKSGNTAIDGILTANQFIGPLQGYARYLETKKRDKDGNGWYGSNYNFYTQWDEDTNNICELKTVGNYDTRATRAFEDADGNVISSTYLKLNGNQLSNSTSTYNQILVANNNSLGYRTKAELRTDLGLATVYFYKGTLENINALKNIASATIGDVYFLSSTSESWSCMKNVTSATGNNYETYWSNLGQNVDLSSYMTLDTNQTVIGVKTFTNNLLLTENSSSIITRSASDIWTAGIYSNSSGDEVLGILVKNSRTHIMLGLGDAKARPIATSLTPAIDIKNNKVGINKRLGTDGNDDAGVYNLDVNGTGNFQDDLRVLGHVFAYNYAKDDGKNAPALVFDKPGGNYTGIGANGTTDTIFFGAVYSAAGEHQFKWCKDVPDAPAETQNYKQKWKFNGSVEADSFNAVSDARLKENFTSLTIQKSILDLPIYKFDFINGTKNQIGCKAQDLQEICPEIVNEDSEGYLSIQESKIVYLLIDEIKKLKGQLDSLNKTIREEC